MREWLEGLLFMVTGTLIGFYVIIYNSACAGRACLYAIPKWLPIWW